MKTQANTRTAHYIYSNILVLQSGDKGAWFVPSISISQGWYHVE